MHRSAMRSSSFFASWTVYAFLMAIGRQLHGTRVRCSDRSGCMRGGGLFHGVFAEHEHAVVLADDRIVHVDLALPIMGPPSTTLCGSFVSPANSMTSRRRVPMMMFALQGRAMRR